MNNEILVAQQAFNVEFRDTTKTKFLQNLKIIIKFNLKYPRSVHYVIQYISIIVIIIFIKQLIIK